MLVLTRKSNQSIMIGDEIEVSVLSVMGEKVRIGIQAPQHIPVFRKEIYLEIHREAGPSAEADSSSEKAQPESDGHRDRSGERSLRKLSDAADQPG
ncbi:MAG: carbon storage regulator [Solirubrobacteraceae bacterium]|jgi:carbon storage regulator|nr:carbon storage regulator [Solirubrobacteraceae bacterium]